MVWRTYDCDEWLQMNQMETENESDRIDMQDKKKTTKKSVEEKATHSGMLQHSNWFGSQSEADTALMLLSLTAWK